MFSIDYKKAFGLPEPVDILYIKLKDVSKYLSEVQKINRKYRKGMKYPLALVVDTLGEKDTIYIEFRRNFFFGDDAEK